MSGKANQHNRWKKFWRILRKKCYNSKKKPITWEHKPSDRNTYHARRHYLGKMFPTLKPSTRRRQTIWRNPDKMTFTTSTNIGTQKWMTSGSKARECWRKWRTNIGRRLWLFACNSKNNSQPRLNNPTSSWIWGKWNNKQPNKKSIFPLTQLCWGSSNPAKG